MERYIIGVDNGSQSTKIMIFDFKGQVVTQASTPLRPMIHRQEGWAEHPDDDIWESIQLILRQVMEQFPYDPKQIVGLGLCSIRCCRVFMKADGTLYAPIMSWMDVRSYETFEDHPEIAYTCTTTGYITYKLTGQYVDTVANAFQWQLPVDVNTWQWSEDPAFFNSFKIPREKLMDLKMPGEILGHVSEEAAKATGLPVGLPVVATANDKAVEALGGGMLDRSLGLVSCGTYLTAMVKGTAYVKDAQSFWTNFACVPDQYLYESNGVRYGMRHVSWFKELIGSEANAQANAQGMPLEEYLDKEAEHIKVGSNGLLIIPDWLAPATELHRKDLL